MKRVQVFLGLASAGMIGLVGCDGTQEPILVEPTAQVVPPMADSSAVRSAYELWPQERLFHELAQKVPGYGGHFFSEEGDLVVYAKDPAAAQAHRQLLLDATDAAARRVRRASGTVRFQPGQFTFEELRAYRDALFAPLFRLNGVIGLDLDEAKNRVRIQIMQENEVKARGDVRQLLQSLKIPQPAVVFEVVLEVRDEVLRTAPVAPAPLLHHLTLQDKVRPIQAGTQILQNVYGFTCTIGWVTLSGSSPAVVTNTHCTGTWGGLDGSASDFFQPSQTVTNGFLGEEQLDYAWWDCGAGGSTPGLKCVYADAAVIEVANGTYAQDEIARPQPYNGIIIDDTSPFYVVGEVPSSVVGMDVWKIGRSTGLTWGKVKVTCVHRNPNSRHPERVYLCQDGADYSSDLGDSGSPVFTEDSSYDVLMVGIHSNYEQLLFGARRYFSPMSQIRKSYPWLPPLLH